MIYKRFAARLKAQDWLAINKVSDNRFAISAAMC